MSICVRLCALVSMGCAHVFTLRCVSLVDICVGVHVLSLCESPRLVSVICLSF